jgi:outer membrane receptor protein involved in Fe transport
MLKNHKKVSVLSIAIGTIVAAGAIGTAPVFAQEEVIEEIVVTGSRIRSAVSDAPRPVTTLPIEEMRLSGVGCRQYY